jgi:hypothetical protein
MPAGLDLEETGGRHSAAGMTENTSHKVYAANHQYLPTIHRIPMPDLCHSVFNKGVDCHFSMPIELSPGHRKYLLGCL